MERTYTVTWTRPDGEVQTCQGLTPRIAFARLWAAWKNSGQITVIDVQPEWLTDNVEGPACTEFNDGRTCVSDDPTGLWCEACVAWSEDFAALDPTVVEMPDSSTLAS